MAAEDAVLARESEIWPVEPTNSIYLVATVNRVVDIKDPAFDPTNHR